MSRLSRISTSTAISLGIALVAAVVIAVSSGVILTKDYPPRLAVEVHGVPGYVYYDREYNLTIEYANLGREAAPSASVSAIIPAGFTLDGVTNATSDEPQRFVWSLGDLAPGQRGEITVKLRGVLKADLTEAVYDLPGYAGHTAFVDGFEMAVEFTSAGAAVTRTASADTGVAVQCTEPGTSGCFFFYKETGLDDGTEFDFSVSVGGGPPAFLTLEDGEFFGIPVPAFPGAIIVTELAEPGWVLQGEASCDGNGVITDLDGATVTITDNPENPNPQNGSCTFTNVPACTNPQTVSNCFYVFKDADPADGTDFSFSATVAGSDKSDFELEDGEFLGFPIPNDSSEVVTVTEDELEGWDFDGFVCTYQGVLSDSGVRTITVWRDPQVTAPVSATCTFHNDIAEPDPTPQPTVHPDPTPRVITQPNIGGGLGGLFAGAPTALPAAVAPAAPPAVIRPPSTGDAGLR